MRKSLSKATTRGSSRAPHQRSSLRLEPLESRFAPAVMIVNPTTATYTDIDGDKVTVKVSSGILTASLFTTAATGPGDQLQAIDLSGGGFDGVNLTISAIKGPTGDGLVNVGHINSTGHDLGVVTLRGDLGQIGAGDATTTTTGLKSLSVRSLGRLGTDTQVGGSLQSDINGALGSLVVAGDLKDAYVNVTGGVDGKIGSITIGGSLIGGSNTFSGAITSTGAIGPVRIGHDVRGGSGNVSGFINAGGKLTGVSIGGSLIGGTGGNSGSIYSDVEMGAVKIGHNMQGGSASFSGRIRSSGKLAGVSIGGSLIGGPGSESGQIRCIGDMGALKIVHDVLGGSGGFSGRIISTTAKIAGVTIGGSLIGGSAPNSGEINSLGDMGAIKIGHNFVGGSITGVTTLDGSGVIQSVGRISSVTIGGSIISGIDSSSGSLTRNATIRAGNDIGLLTIKGSLIGNVTADGASPVVISARGQAVQGATTDLAIGSIRIGGHVEFANILAGYNTNLDPVNGDAQIGSVFVGGDWIASNLVSGVTDGGDGFGDDNDVAIAGGSPNIVSRIGRVVIGGLVYGTPDASGNDQFGFVAQQIGLFRSFGLVANFTTSPNESMDLARTTSDVTIREVS